MAKTPKPMKKIVWLIIFLILKKTSAAINIKYNKALVISDSIKDFLSATNPLNKSFAGVI